MISKVFSTIVLVFNTEAYMTHKIGRVEAAKLVNSGKYYKGHGSAIAEIREKKR